MVDFDSYMHFENSMSIATSSTITGRILPVTGGAYITYLSLLYPLFNDPASALSSIRVINLFASVQLIIFFYMIARKMFNQFFSLAGALMASFMPILLSYSGTLESNVFASSMGFAAIYFSIKPRRLVSLVLATVFIILTSSRLDELIVFLIPYFVGLVYYISYKTHLKFSILLTIVILGFFVPVYFFIQARGGIYKSTYFHHNIMEQVITLTNFDTIKMVLQSSVEITGEKAVNIIGNSGLNEFYLSILLIGIIFFISNSRKTILKILTLKSHHFDEASVTVIYLTILIFISLITLTAFHLNFKIEGEHMVIEKHILPRYMIDIRLFLLFGFTYGMSLVAVFFRLVTNLATKHKEELQNSLSEISDTLHLHTKNLVNETTTLFRIESRYFSYIFVVFVLVLFSNAMWDSAVRFYEDLATQLQIHHEATQWLSKNLGENEKAFLPMPQTFWALDPTLKSRTYTYKSVWDSLDIIRKPETTNAEIQKVRQSLIEFYHNDTNRVKYLIFDWVDENGKVGSGISPDILALKNSCEKLDPTLRQVMKFTFKLPYSSSKWGSAMVVCEVQKITN